MMFFHIHIYYPETILIDATFPISDRQSVFCYNAIHLFYNHIFTDASSLFFGEAAEQCGLLPHILLTHLDNHTLRLLNFVL